MHFQQRERGLEDYHKLRATFAEELAQRLAPLTSQDVEEIARRTGVSVRLVVAKAAAAGFYLQSEDGGSKRDTTPQTNKTAKRKPTLSEILPQDRLSEIVDRSVYNEFFDKDGYSSDDRGDGYLLYRYAFNSKTYMVLTESQVLSIAGHSRSSIECVEKRLKKLGGSVVSDVEMAERALRRREYHNSERTGKKASFWSSNLFVLGSISLALTLLLGMCVGGDSNETREHRLIRELQDGQRAVCEKWGDLRPECR